MKYAFTALFMLLAVLDSEAQITVEMPIGLKNGAPLSKLYTLVVGIDSRATNCLDKELNEVDLPPPPPDFYPLLLPGCKDTNSGTTITLNRDYRPIPSQHFSHTYDVKMLRGPNREDVDITWNKDLPDQIDSAFLLIEFVDTLDMSQQDKFVITNDFISDAQIRIYYSVPTVGVGEHDALAEPKIFPQPVGETLMFSTAKYKGGFYALYSANGWKMQTAAIDNSERMAIDVSKLPAGVYFLHLNTAMGAGKVLHFVKE